MRAEDFPQDFVPLGWCVSLADFKNSLFIPPMIDRAQTHLVEFKHRQITTDGRVR